MEQKPSKYEELNFKIAKQAIRRQQILRANSTSI